MFRLVLNQTGNCIALIVITFSQRQNESEINLRRKRTLFQLLKLPIQFKEPGMIILMRYFDKVNSPLLPKNRWKSVFSFFKIVVNSLRFSFLKMEILYVRAKPICQTDTP